MYIYIYIFIYLFIYLADNTDADKPQVTKPSTVPVELPIERHTAKI